MCTVLYLEIDSHFISSFVNILIQIPKLKLGAKGKGGPGLFKMPKFGQKCLVQTNNYKQTYKYNTHTHLAPSACMTQGTIGRVCVQYTCTHNKQTSH